MHALYLPYTILFLAPRGLHVGTERWWAVQADVPLLEGGTREQTIKPLKSYLAARGGFVRRPRLCGMRVGCADLFVFLTFHSFFRLGKKNNNEGCS